MIAHRLSTAALVVLLLGTMAYALADCAATPAPKPCPLKLEADYTAALVAACKDAGSVEACGDAGKAITAEHEAEQVDGGCRVK